MFRIRKAQIDSLSSLTLHEANHRLVVYARQRFPGQFAEPNAVGARELIDRVRETAKGYGIEREDDVATFLDFTVMYGENFHRAPWAAEVLECKVLHAPDKMGVLRQRVRQSGVIL